MPYSSQMSHLAPGGLFFFFACVTSAVQNRFPHGQARAVSVPAPACAFCPDTYSADGCAAQTFQTYGTNFRSHPAQRPLGRACATAHAAAANAVRIHFRPVPRFAAAPPLSPNPWERHFPGCTAFPTGILPRAPRICAQIRQTPAPLRQKAVPRILRPQHGLSRSENISQACIWQIRSHAPQHVQTSPRLSFRRRTATSHPRAAFRARIPQNDFPAL